MAACSLAVKSQSTTDGTSFATGAWTPAANDLLLAFVVASGTVATGSFSTSAGTTFTKVTSALKNTSADTIYCFIANALSSASSQTATFDCTGDSATGACITVIAISGMTRTGASAIKQSKVISNHASATPAITFDTSALTGNPTLGVIGNATQPPGLTPPTSWTEINDDGYLTPATGIETVSRNSGFTGTTITWGSSSGTAWGGIIVELDASAISTAIANSLMLLRCGT